MDPDGDGVVNLREADWSYAQRKCLAGPSRGAGLWSLSSEGCSVELERPLLGGKHQGPVVLCCSLALHMPRPDVALEANEVKLALLLLLLLIVAGVLDPNHMPWTQRL